MQPQPLRLAWRQAGRQLRRFAVLLLFVVALIAPTLASGSVLPSATSASGQVNAHSAVRIEPAPAENAPGPVVKVGLHVRNIYDLSLVDQSFLAEGWYWLDWGPDVEVILKRQRIEPRDIVELANEIELGQYSSQEISPASQVLSKPGRYGITVRFSGKFYLNDIPQRYAPFDPQRLSIQVEVKAESLAIGRQALRLEPAIPADQIAGEQVDLGGYELDRVSWERSQLVYPEAFLPQGKFSRVSAVFVYGKNEWAMFLKWIFPVLIVMAIVIVSPSIEGVLGDIRLAIPPSALLTLVVMQDTFKNSFPPAPYLTYLDELYVYSYIICLAIFLLFLVGTNLIARAGEDQREAITHRVNRIDAVVQVSTLMGFVVVGLVGWFT